MVVSRAEQAMMSALCLAAASMFGRGHAVAEVDDVEALGFHHHADKVLAVCWRSSLMVPMTTVPFFFHLVAHEEGRGHRFRRPSRGRR